MKLVSPLARIGSLKTKLSVIIVLAIVVSALISAVGSATHLPFFVPPLTASLVSLVLVRWLAHGTTSPLRDMAAAAHAMTHGDYSQRVRTSSNDEVGQLAASFNAMAAELAETDRIRRDLVANVSHELRTPIGALQAILENIVDGVSAPDLDTMRAMHEQIERLGRLVGDLLDLSRLESGAIPLDHRTLAVADVVEHAKKECVLHHPALSITANIEPPELTVPGDAARLHQVLVNLFDNAARHAGADRLVLVDAARFAGRVRITVTDHGPGIAPEDRDRVFERFYRADRSRSVHEGGSGLGLAITRWIVELHGGQIEAQSAKPRGCMMVVELPA